MSSLSALNDHESWHEIYERNLGSIPGVVGGSSNV